MKSLLKKEFTLSANVLTYVFLLFSCMTWIPGYPILVGTFFITLGIFYTFQNVREQNDILFSALLPVSKRDIVGAKFLFVLILEIAAFLLSAVFTIFRMTLLSSATVYTENALMNANIAYLGYILLLFAAFQWFFLRDFFRTAYKICVPFLIYCIVAFIVVGIAETLHHVPGLESLNSTAPTLSQWIVFGLGLAVFAFATWRAYVASVKDFDALDL